MGTLYSLYPVRIWKTNALCYVVERSKITNFDQESEKADSAFANHPLKTQASSIFEIKPRALRADLNYIREGRFPERIRVQLI